MKRLLLFLTLLLPLVVQAQVTTLIGKTANQLAGSVVDLQTDLDAAYFNGFGQNDLYLRNAVLERGISVSDYSTLAAAINAAESDSNYVIVAAASTITATDTVRAHAGLIFTGGGDSRVTISSGVTLYVNGAFWAPPNKQVFYGAGTVIFGPGVLSKVYPEWWGAKADSSTNSATAFKAAYTAMPNGAAIELLAGGRTLGGSKGYIINSTVRVPADKNTRLNGYGAVIYSTGSDTVLFFNNGSQTTVPSFAVSPTRDQPRHIVDGLRFKRISGSLAAGVAIAALNTTGLSIWNTDFYGYRNAVVFNNQSDGWCENNDLFNLRIAGADTGVIYRVSNSGNNSFATNSLRKVTITAFDSVNARDGIGVFASSGSNLYRNYWDQVVVFPRDSVTCFYFNGKAEDLTGNAHIEYIGAKHRNAMKGFHFASSASDLRFKLHVNITGRIYFDEPNLFYSEIPGSFGYTGITTSLDGNQNHGIEMVVDSSKFTPWFGVIKNSRLGMTTPADSGRILFANFNNSGAGKLDIRARRNSTIEIRGITDNVYSAATANTVRGSALPLQPVGLLDIGGGIRSIQDSTTIDVRNVTAMIVSNSSSTVPYTLSAFKGGIAGQTITVTFSSSKVYLANLRGTSGSGRLFLLEGDSTYTQSGMKSFFRCESESGGVFWREMWRSAEYGKTTNHTSTTADSVDAAQVNFIRLNMSSAGNMSNFYNGIDGQRITVLHRTANTTMKHLNRGTSKGLSLIGAADLTGTIGLREDFVYDASDDLWREVSRSTNTGGGSGWTDTGTVVNLETTTDNLVIGDSNTGAKVIIDGDTDETQLFIKGHSTQTNPYINIHTNGSATVWAVSTPSGSLHRQTMPNGGTLEITAATITPPTNLDKGIVIGNNTTATISGQPANTFTLYGTGGEAVINDAQGVVSKLTHAWGALYMSNATNTISTSGTAGTWVKVTGFTLESSPAGQGITAVADSFTVTTAGTYEISVNISLVGTAASTDNLKFAVAKNSTANTNYQAAVTTADNTTIVNLSFSGYYVGAVNDRYSLLSTNNSDGDDFTIKQASFTIRRIN